MYSGDEKDLAKQFFDRTKDLDKPSNNLQLKYGTGAETVTFRLQLQTEEGNQRLFNLRLEQPLKISLLSQEKYIEILQDEESGNRLFKNLTNIADENVKDELSKRESHRHFDFCEVITNEEDMDIFFDSIKSAAGN